MESIAAQYGEQHKAEVNRLSSVLAGLPGVEKILMESEASYQGSREEEENQRLKIEKERNSMRAVHLSPWEKKNWVALELSLE